MVRQVVESGEYGTWDDIVADALLEWRLRRELNSAEGEALCRLWDEGLTSGPGRFNGIDEIKREARRRWTDERSRSTG
ncbi:MAG: type II toxin-antitoxin system ParD family antitoxin [Alphaproteobacteria bacterium]|nr:type II toxin-antitoxin system ParD family antitoxin [Alphaproteobacteria bacterium]